MPKRLFVALDLPEAFHDRLDALRDETLPARWTPPGQYHLTLRFLGDTSNRHVDEVAAALENVPRRPAAAFLDDLTVFPSKRKPRVLALAGAPDAGLVVLQRQVEAAAVALGYRPVGRPFTPHVTLARFKGIRPQLVRGYLKAHADAEPIFLETEAFHLYESVLTPDGAVHHRIATFADDPAPSPADADAPPGDDA